MPVRRSSAGVPGPVDPSQVAVIGVHNSPILPAPSDPVSPPMPPPGAPGPAASGRHPTPPPVMGILQSPLQHAIAGAVALQASPSERIIRYQRRQESLAEWQAQASLRGPASLLGLTSSVATSEPYLCPVLGAVAGSALPPSSALPSRSTGTPWGAASGESGSSTGGDAVDNDAHPRLPRTPPLVPDRRAAPDDKTSVGVAPAVAPAAALSSPSAAMQPRSGLRPPVHSPGSSRWAQAPVSGGAAAARVMAVTTVAASGAVAPPATAPPPSRSRRASDVSGALATRATSGSATSHSRHGNGGGGSGSTGVQQRGMIFAAPETSVQTGPRGDGRLPVLGVALGA